MKSYIKSDKNGFINPWKSYNTQLSPIDLRKFNIWIKKISTLKGRNLLETDGNVYDFHAYWLYYVKNKNLEGITKEQHFKDIGKKPTHPTFSVESIWNGSINEFGNKNIGGKWKHPDKNGKWSFTPSMQQFEDGTKFMTLYNEYKRLHDFDLIIPKSKHKIDFPTFEYKQLKKTLDAKGNISSHRIWSKYGQYELGKIYYNKVLGNLLVIKSCMLADITMSPHYDAMSSWTTKQIDEQKRNIGPVQYIELIHI